MVKSINEIIHSIYEGAILVINDNEYKVISMCSYRGKNNTELYYKVFLEDNFVLVLILDEEFAYFGQNIGDSGIKIPIPEKINFEGVDYKYSFDDYQELEQAFFGEIYEKELNYWDYEAQDEESQAIVSFLVDKDGKRFDTIADIIDLEDVKLG